LWEKINKKVEPKSTIIFFRILRHDNKQQIVVIIEIRKWNHIIFKREQNKNSTQFKKTEWHYNQLPQLVHQQHFNEIVNRYNIIPSRKSIIWHNKHLYAQWSLIPCHINLLIITNLFCLKLLKYILLKYYNIWVCDEERFNIKHHTTCRHEHLNLTSCR